jgi:hypothetical protein
MYDPGTDTGELDDPWGGLDEADDEFAVSARDQEGTRAGEGLPQTVVLHVDIDSFYCEVERMDDPSLRGRPLVVQQFNAGQDPVQGLLPDGPTALFAGAAADPQSPSWSGLKSRLVRKKQAGARFVQTQMVMDAEALKRFVGELAAPLELPVLAGVFLLKSARNAAFINRVVPGANSPQSVIDRLAAAADPAAEGVAIAAEQVADYLQIAQGVHLMAIKAEEKIPAILQQAGLAPLQPVLLAG